MPRVPQVIPQMLPTDIDKLAKLIDPAIQTIAAHKLDFVLPPRGLSRTTYALPDLAWHSIPYNEPAAFDSVPDDKAGLYAFSIRGSSTALPPHGYIVYIGAVGFKPNRTLRDRYKEYLSVRRVLKRERIARMIRSWHQVLTFHYAPVPSTVTPAELGQMERHLNSTLIPPFSVRDLDSKVKQQRTAFS